MVEDRRWGVKCVRSQQAARQCCHDSASPRSACTANRWLGVAPLSRSCRAAGHNKSLASAPSLLLATAVRLRTPAVSTSLNLRPSFRVTSAGRSWQGARKRRRGSWYAEKAMCACNNLVFMPGVACPWSRKKKNTTSQEAHAKWERQKTKARQPNTAAWSMQLLCREARTCVDGIARGARHVADN